MNYLEEIFAKKKDEVSRQKALLPEAWYRERARHSPPVRSFIGSLKKPAGIALIAEVKHKSPSKGILLENFDPVTLASIYAENGASAISVLTDEHFFGGSLLHLEAIRAAVRDKPLLRKDFIFDPYQVFQARCHGADAVLLIAAALKAAELKELHTLTLDLGMTPLVEVHSREDLSKALLVEPVLIGINNRDLSTFEVDIQTTLQLRPLIPGNILVVSESGIRSAQDVNLLKENKVDAILVGEAIVTASFIANMVRSLSENHRGREESS